MMSDKGLTHAVTTTTTTVVSLQQTCTTTAASLGATVQTSPSTAGPSMTTASSGDVMAFVQTAVMTAMMPLLQRINALEAATKALAPTPQDPTMSTAEQATHTSTEGPSSDEDNMPSEDSSNSSSSSMEQAGTARKPSSRKRKKSRRSGRLRTAADHVDSTVEWPHFAVYKGDSCQAAEYDDLTLPEFVYGYLDVMKNSNDSAKTKDIMLTHLQELMEDATLFSWRSVRNYHGVLLTELERRRLRWTDCSKIQRLRSKYSQKQATCDTTQDVVPCAGFNEGTCMRDGDHGNVSHVCSFCIKYRGKTFFHPETNCYNKGGRPTWKSAIANGGK